MCTYLVFVPLFLDVAVVATVDLAQCLLLLRHFYDARGRGRVVIVTRTSYENSPREKPRSFRKDPVRTGRANGLPQ
jgi:hypothetical protein